MSAGAGAQSHSWAWGPEAVVSGPVAALWVQGAFLGAVAALQGKQSELEGVCAWHRAKGLFSPTLQ